MNPTRWYCKLCNQVSMRSPEDMPDGCHVCGNRDFWTLEPGLGPDRATPMAEVVTMADIEAMEALVAGEDVPISYGLVEDLGGGTALSAEGAAWGYEDLRD